MSQQITITCPVSTERVNETVVRIVAAFTVLLTAVGLLPNNFFIAGFLVIDFSLRAFYNGKGSLLKVLAKQLSFWFHLKQKQVDSAPKKFAAGLGVLFSAFIFIFQLIGFFTLAKIVGVTLIICALLESVAGICLGCIVYSWLNSLNIIVTQK
jgi:hypothetical protein